MTINSFWQGWVFAAAAVSGLLIISPVANGADLKAAEKVLQRGYYEVAEREIEPAALSGNAHAQFLMGELYQRPNFWKCRLETSLAWYEKSADQGYARANTRLGFIYRYGLGVEKDPARAFVLFKRAAFSGDPSAQKLLGEMYLGGVAGSRDVSEAAYWLQRQQRMGVHLPFQCWPECTQMVLVCQEIRRRPTLYCRMTSCWFLMPRAGPSSAS